MKKYLGLKLTFAISFGLFLSFLVCSAASAMDDLSKDAVLKQPDLLEPVTVPDDLEQSASVTVNSINSVESSASDMGAVSASDAESYSDNGYLRKGSESAD